MEKISNYSLYLDDYRNPEDCCGYVFNLGIRPDTYINREWVIVRDYNQFVKYIDENGLPVLISFDHDLAFDHYCPEEFYDTYDEWAKEQNFQEKTGLDCAKWLVDFCIDNKKDLPDFLVHSMNPWGRTNIKAYLDNYLKSTKDEE